MNKWYTQPPPTEFNTVFNNLYVYNHNRTYVALDFTAYKFTGRLYTMKITSEYISHCMYLHARTHVFIHVHGQHRCTHIHRYHS